MQLANSLTLLKKNDFVEQQGWRVSKSLWIKACYLVLIGALVASTKLNHTPGYSMVPSHSASSRLSKAFH
jgi:hypothetical protein